jgi:hypothetical protein
MGFTLSDWYASSPTMYLYMPSLLLGVEMLLLGYWVFFFFGGFGMPPIFGVVWNFYI